MKLPEQTNSLRQFRYYERGSSVRHSSNVAVFDDDEDTPKCYFNKYNSYFSPYFFPVPCSFHVIFLLYFQGGVSTWFFVAHCLRLRPIKNASFDAYLSSQYMVIVRGGYIEWHAHYVKTLVSIDGPSRIGTSIVSPKPYLRHPGRICR